MRSCSMSEALSEIKARILQLDAQLRDTRDTPTPAPEMLNTTNALRLCEHLVETDSVKSKLIQEYEQYSTGLEDLIKEALQIQKDLNAFLQKSKRPIRKPQRKTPVKRKTTKRKPILRKTVRKKLKRKPLKRKALRKPKRNTSKILSSRFSKQIMLHPCYLFLI